MTRRTQDWQFTGLQRQGIPRNRQVTGQRAVRVRQQSNKKVGVAFLDRARGS
jgi:hypothetical protein